MVTLRAPIAALLLALSFSAAQAQSAPAPAAKATTPATKAADEAHRKEDIAKHRQMARAHEEAARCLESGEKESTCQERLRTACSGIAVGRYCGMRHAH
jgi:hypothetical protein